jgi:hypothetical protein
MRWFLKSMLVLALLAVIALPLGLLAAALLAVDDAPLLTRSADIRPENIARAQRIIERNDPRRMRNGTLRSIIVGAEDADLAANYIAHQYLKGSASVSLPPGGAVVRASLPLPANPLGRYLNLDMALGETAHLPRIESLRLGRLPVPALIANFALDWLLVRPQFTGSAGDAADAVKRVYLRGGTVQVVFEWNENLPSKLRGVLVSAEDELRLKACQAVLARVAEGGTAPLPFEAALGELLKAAGARGGDPVAENRALVIALAFFVNGKGLGAIIPAAREWPPVPPRHVTLGGRHDFAQHFSISAAIAATAGSALSDAIGLYKEIEDSRGGSGFSFNDIAADRAGTRLGVAATADAGAARRLQAAAAARLAASTFFPEVNDLPEFMQEAEFKRRYGGVGGTEYRRMMGEIERRVAGLALYR